MILKNNTAAVLNVAGRHVLPKQNVKLADSYAKNPVIVKLVKAGKLIEVKKAEEAGAEEAVAAAGTETVAEADATSASLDSFKELLGSKPTLTKLKSYAKKNGIDLGEAKTEEEIVAVITACLSVA